MKEKKKIKAIIGLGNPGPQYRNNRHNIGFHILDILAELYGGQWKEKGPMVIAHIVLNSESLLLVKPQTFMNASGKVIPLLQKQGITPEEMIVVHDELEKKFGAVSVRQGGSHRGHNGLRSIMEQSGDNFWRVRCGIGRPERKEEVGAYVLSNFTESEGEVADLTEEAISLIKGLVASNIE